MMDNLNVLREAIMDLSAEFDSNYTEIEKLKLTDKRIFTGIEEMQGKFDFIRSKMETKLFSGMSEAAESPTKAALGSPTASPAQMSVKGMLSPKAGAADLGSQMELMRRVQKLELASNRLLADSGKLGEGYMLTTPTASEQQLALA